MDVGKLASRHPVLYHMAEDGSWESIRRLGLLSTSALLDGFEVGEGRRRRIESARRPEMEAIEHPEHGRALIWDNKPMQETVLERCLTGMTPREWYETLNRRVFFWLDRRRLLRLLCARAYRDRPHLVLELDTAELLRRHAEDVTLSAINSGATFAMNPAPRGPHTFRRVEDHPRGKAVVELAVDYAVPGAADFTCRVSRWRGGGELGEVWRKG
ncbi:hypothetical protein GBA63_08280 [Rubrobacter tropicus]|uniref:Uncharacterized protein n=1 Tax=Rubrobacter tropicus TaxID=2653851 RepID=A0A6G8Q864_9ACTN|nr:hypothetical protein [Rubrobacter tropicus]QIN82639.1 hypothetical protein GBA63_08280 [Rubrobacter tropicus]